MKRRLFELGLAVAAVCGLSAGVSAMCGYFRPIIIDIKQPAPEILQPSQIAFITWDPVKKMETVTVQPRFEGNARDFGMVIPTPGKPKLDEMPRDFFKALGTYTRPKQRVHPQSRLMPMNFPQANMAFGRAQKVAPPGAGGIEAPPPRPTTVEVVDVGVVGSLEYKVLTAGRADDLYKWLKDNKFSYAGDEATLEHYVKKNYYFTVMRIDTLQMKKNKDGSFVGDVTPTRFTFPSDKLVYPTKITQVSVKDGTEAVFYVQAPYKMDLEGDMSYRHQWVSMLEFARDNMGIQDLPERNRKFLEGIAKDLPELRQHTAKLGFGFRLDARLEPNGKGHTPCTLEWARQLTKKDLGILSGDERYSEKVPDPDDGFTQADLRDGRRAQAIFQVIQRRLEAAQRERPRGYQIREASKEEMKTLPLLQGHLQEGQYLTRFRKTFTRGEMNEDLVMVQSKVGRVEDNSEYEEWLRTLMFEGGGRFRGPRFDLVPGGLQPALPLPPP